METENGGFAIWPALFRDENRTAVRYNGFLHRLPFSPFRRRRSGSTRDCTFLPNLKREVEQETSQTFGFGPRLQSEKLPEPLFYLLFFSFFLFYFYFFPQDRARKRFRDYKFVMSSKYCMFHVSLSCWELATPLCFPLFPPTKRRFVLKQRRIFYSYKLKVAGVWNICVYFE